ncbi:MAG: pilus assembly protein TadG-related protein [Patescibacteria group bacterium]
MEKQKQYQKGYAAPVILLFILATITLLVFVVEFGRVVETRTHLNNGVELAVSAGAHAYGKELKKRLDEAYDKAEQQAKQTVEDKINAGEVDAADEDKEVTEEIKKLMKEQAGDITNAARQTCKSEAESIITMHELSVITVSCSDTEAHVTASTVYDQQIHGIVQFPTKEFRESSTEDIKIIKE